MVISLLQLNIESGRFIDEIIAYIKKHDFDILQLQEVSGGTFNRYRPIDTFQILKEHLGYDGILTKTLGHVHDERAYFGKATLFKPTFDIIAQEEIWMKPFEKTTDFPKQNELVQQLPQNALSVQLGIERNIINLVNTHLAWGPTPDDEPYKIEQGNILIEYMKKVEKPFILSGDFNVTPDSEIIKGFDLIARNLTTEHAITNTLNAHTHRVQKLFPQGLAVDYIYIDNKTKVNSFSVIQEDLSDHLGLQVIFEM